MKSFSNQDAYTVLVFNSFEDKYYMFFNNFKYER